MKSFFLKLIAFVALVLAAQVVIARYIEPDPLVSSLNGYLRDRTQILFFGDSSVLPTGGSSDNQSSIIELFQTANPAYKLGDLAHPAYHSGIYEAVLDYISRAPSKPQAIIFPVQLRSFSPEWDMRPVNQFEKEIFLLKDRTSFISYFYTPLAILRAIDVNSVSYTEFLKTPVYYGQKQAGIVEDFEAVDKNKPATEENIRDDYVYKYMFKLDRNQRKMKSLESLLDLADKAGTKIYVYISPIDYETGTKFIGNDFVEQVAYNANLVCSVLEDKKMPCLDLTLSLTRDYFDYPAYPSEHLTAQGKRFVADRINAFFNQNPPR